jgi:nicotinamidase-related amidase
MKHKTTVLSAASLALLALTALVRADAHPPIETLRDLYRLPAVSVLDPARTALLFVDFQEEFFRGALPLPEGPRALSGAVELRRWARAHAVNVVHVRNVVARADSRAFAPGSLGAQIVASLAPQPGELLFTKAAGGAFSSADLDGWLRAQRIETVIVSGLMTHLAVSLTASDAALRGYHVIVAADSTASRALPSAPSGAAIDHQTVQRVALATLADRVAEVLTNAQIRALPMRPLPER